VTLAYSLGSEDVPRYLIRHQNGIYGAVVTPRHGYPRAISALSP
jgi:hypothetical protein